MLRERIGSSHFIYPRPQKPNPFYCPFSFIAKSGSSFLSDTEVTEVTVPTFTYVTPFSAKKQACGPEARALRAKSMGREKILPRDPALLPQNGAGRSGARPGAPPSDYPRFREGTACPPGPRQEACLMLFVANPLASGPGKD